LHGEACADVAKVSVGSTFHGEAHTFVDINAILPGDAMGACRGRMLAILVVLLGNLFQLLFTFAVVGILFFFPLTRAPVLPHALQLPQHALGMGTPRLDVFEDCGLDLVAHGKESAA
jgi:hypothetical protein